MSIDADQFLAAMAANFYEDAVEADTTDEEIRELAVECVEIMMLSQGGIVSDIETGESVRVHQVDRQAAEAECIELLMDERDELRGEQA